MKTIYTLSIKCVWGAYFNDRFLRVIEVPSDMTLGDLHFLILNLSEFDNDHLSTFYTANTLRGKKVWFTESDEWEEGHDALSDGPLWDIPLHDIFPLPKHKKLYYWFDFGDDWKFEIRKKGKDKTPVSGVNYPRVIQEEGPKPEQYPIFEE
jgi:hypothetical protein